MLKLEYIQSYQQLSFLVLLALYPFVVYFVPEISTAAFCCIPCGCALDLWQLSSLQPLDFCYLHLLLLSIHAIRINIILLPLGPYKHSVIIRIAILSKY